VPRPARLHHRGTLQRTPRKCRQRRSHRDTEGAVSALPASNPFINTSEQRIYHVELRWHLGSAGYGQPNPEPLGVTMPGSSASMERKFPDDAITGTCSAVVRFTDAAGVRWRRRPDSDLTQAGSTEQPPVLLTDPWSGSRLGLETQTASLNLSLVISLVP
jgi:hypothetical protein